MPPMIPYWRKNLQQRMRDHITYLGKHLGRMTIEDRIMYNKIREILEGGYGDLDAGTVNERARERELEEKSMFEVEQEIEAENFEKLGPELYWGEKAMRARIEGKHRLAREFDKLAIKSSYPEEIIELADKIEADIGKDNISYDECIKAADRIAEGEDYDAVVGDSLEKYEKILESYVRKYHGSHIEENVEREEARNLEDIASSSSDIRERAENLREFWQTKGVKLNGREWQEIAYRVENGEEIANILGDYRYVIEYGDGDEDEEDEEEDEEEEEKETEEKEKEEEEDNYEDEED